MSLRFLADHCVSEAISHTLEAAGHEVHRLREHLPIDSPDMTVIEKAQEIDAILISLNGDFADIITYPPSDYRGIVSLQVRNHPEVVPQIMAVLTKYLSANPDRTQYIGKLFLVETHRIRFRT